MSKFSIIVPVYNVEKYIKKCLDSIMNQTYKDYEVIVINDGTKDHSMDIVKKYPVKIINQKNKGLSGARNAGAKEAKGEYLIFVDSDDYLNENLLEEIAKSLENKPDIVRYQIQEVYEDGKIIPYNEEPFYNKTGQEAFELITKYHYVEVAWSMAIKNSYYKKEKFKFKEKAIHEDFGLMPLVLIKAPIVNSISYIGYNYFQRSNGIMQTKDYAKTQKKVKDMYDHYLYLSNEIDKTSLDSKIFKSFIANSIILKTCELNKNDYKEYKKKLYKDKVYDNLLANTIPRKIKIMLLKISPKLYYMKRK